MTRSDKKKTKKRSKSLEESMKAILDKAQAREKAGRDSFEAGWQASLEIILLMMEKPFLEHPGQMLPMQISGEEEWEFYYELLEKLDLPPDVCAVLITPSTFKNISVSREAETVMGGFARWERNSFSIIISGLQDHTVVMHVALPGLKSVGIDVFEDGRRLADYRYNTIKECLNDLTKVTWIYFNPKSWAEDQIILYTENWFAKGVDIEVGDVRVHDQYSYIHHPELLGLTPLEAAFKVIVATIPKDYDSLEKSIKMANELNKDFGLGDPVINKEGILRDKTDECQALLGRIAFEIDQLLDSLDYIEGVETLKRSVTDSKYKDMFDRAARNIYERITGRACPESVELW